MFLKDYSTETLDKYLYNGYVIGDESFNVLLEKRGMIMKLKGLADQKLHKIEDRIM